MPPPGKHGRPRLHNYAESRRMRVPKIRENSPSPVSSPSPVYSPNHYDVPAPSDSSDDSSDELEMMLTEHQRAARDVVEKLIRTIEDYEILGCL